MAENKGMMITGRVLTVLIGLGLLASAAMKIVQPADFLAQWSKFGFSLELTKYIGAIEIACAVLYLIPQTAMLGTLLVVAYMGGATVIHLRVGDPVSELIVPIITGMVAVLALFLRDSRLRALLPLRR